MASYLKRGKTWQYTISRMINGKPDPIRKGGFRTKAEAQAEVGEIEAKLRKGITPHLKPEPFDDYFAEWLELYKTDVANNTMERYLNTSKTIREHFAGVPIQDITKRSYQAFLNEYGKTRAKDTVRKLNTHVRACVRDAIDEGIIHVDFTRNAVISGSVPAKSPQEKHLNYFESKRLLKHLYDNLTTPTHYLLLLGVTSGLRFGELVGLTRKDFNFKTNELSVSKTWGYTKKMHEGFGPTKNGKSRTIKMDKTVMQVIKEYFERTPENIQGLVFYSTQSKYHVISNGAANKALEEILTKLSIDPISVHGLRHTHASILLYRKVSIYYVAERLGDDVETVNEHYAHIVKELREQDEKSTVETFESMAK